jgi:hypothetical protein
MHFGFGCVQPRAEQLRDASSGDFTCCFDQLECVGWPVEVGSGNP